MIETTLDAQRDLEGASLTVGLRRYTSAQEKLAKREGHESRDEIAKLIRGARPILSGAIRKWRAERATARGSKPTGYHETAPLDPDLLAQITLSNIFRAIGRDGGRVTRIVTNIGRGVEVELEAQALEEADPNAVKRIAALVERRAGRSTLEDTHRESTVEAGVDLNWPSFQRAGVGTCLLGIALYELREVFLRKTEDGQHVVRLTAEAEAILAGMRERLEDTKAQFTPMIVPPRPWTALHSGCYHDVRLSKLVPLVRTFSSEHKRHLKAAIADGSMQEVLDAVNAIQETRWAIDTHVLRMVNWCREQGLRPTKSFPATTLPDAPVKMAAEEWAALDPVQQTAISRHRKAVRDIRAGAAVDAYVFEQDVGMAEFLAENEAFWMPHSLDFRGRVYAVPHFNHQRSDHMKAMFHFADAVPLGPNGGDWLMIHLANCGDFNKMSKKTFPERIAWVKRHHAKLLRIAAAPEGRYRMWSKADSPFCFLQACFEYAAWAESGFSPDFLSTIAIAADGSCSGLQHYSAITRSAEEAFRVNLMPRDTVGDIYQDVAAVALPALKASAMGGCELSALVLSNGFGRSEVKRNVMTYFYGSARFGMRDQHMEDTMRPLADKVAMGELEKHPYAVLTERTDKETGEVTHALDGGYSCAQVMANSVFDAILFVASDAHVAATWVQQTAAVLAKEDLSMIWRTPTGFPVVQRYETFNTREVSSSILNRKLKVATGKNTYAPDGSVLERIKITIREAPTGRVEKKRMRSAASPNVIHSMDGAHLQRSVAMAHAEGIRHFAMIHDSFGTHAGNMDAFSRIIREAFIKTYEDYCPLAELDRYARSVLSDEGIEKLQALPEKGDLDLNCIRESLYAFA